jgi:hypothetical protein
MQYYTFLPTSMSNRADYEWFEHMKASGFPLTQTAPAWTCSIVSECKRLAYEAELDLAPIRTQLVIFTSASSDKASISQVLVASDILC